MKQLLFLLTLVLSSSFVSAQDFAEMDKSPMDAAYFPARAAFRAFAKTDAEKAALAPKIRVLYSRPMKKDRAVMGDKLVPYGEPYRLGANESAEIIFMTEVQIGKTRVGAGRYTIYAIPTAKEWEVVINTDVDGWGAYAYDAAKNVASITVPVQKSVDDIEAFSMTFYEAPSGMAHLKIGWENTIIEVPIKVLTGEK